jgi:four helix bundle protein
LATISRFQEIEAWKKARELTKAVYICSKKGAFAKDFGLRNQIQRATVSIMSNIAEGFERGGSAEFINFLSIAKASAGEVESHLYVALDQGYISEAEFRRLYGLVTSTKKLIAGFMLYLRNLKHRGQKYKTQPDPLKPETINHKPETINQKPETP